MRDTWWRVGGWAIHGWEAGSGPSVVLVHGLGVSGRYLLPTARALAPDFRVLVPDLPGFGASTRPQRPLRLAELSGLLDRFAEAAGVERGIFLANSFGCQIVTHLAATTRPGRVERLVLVGPTVDDSARDPFRQAGRLLADALREPPALVRLVVGDYVRTGPVTVAATAAEALRDRIEENALRVRAPALVVRGSLDTLVPQSWAERLAAAFPMGRLYVVEGAPHAVNYVAPAELAALVSPGSRSVHG